MAEEMTNQDNPLEADYLAQIQQLKDTTVSRDRYDKMVQENKKLMDALVNNKQIDNPAPKASIEDLRKKLFEGTHDNLTYVQTALELRDRLIEEGQEDPFVPQGKKITATREDYALAEKVAEGLKSCIEYADGDSDIFTQELQRITKDTIIPKVNKRR